MLSGCYTTVHLHYPLSGFVSDLMGVDEVEVCLLVFGAHGSGLMEVCGLELLMA